MKVIQLIEADVARVTTTPIWKKLLFSILLFLTPAALGLFLRADLNGVFELKVVLPNLLASLFLASLPFTYEARAINKNYFLGSVLLMGASLFLASERVCFPLAPDAGFTNSAAFWSASANCFMKGSLATFVMGTLYSVFIFGFSSWPSRRYRILISGMSGVAGATMLGFHCDSASLAHVASAHWGQGVLIGGVGFVIQEMYFRYRLKTQLGEWGAKLRRANRLAE